jgi:hypothetical protein|eukprot:COSAG06_NODE_2313_length_7098_cov_7.885412_9_plen_103_part_00
MLEVSFGERDGGGSGVLPSIELLNLYSFSSLGAPCHLLACFLHQEGWRGQERGQVTGRPQARAPEQAVTLTSHVLHGNLHSGDSRQTNMAARTTTSPQQLSN